MKKIVLNTYVIRNNNGVDVNATMDKFHKDIVELMSHEENDLNVISKVIEMVFDKHLGVVFNTKAVIHAALIEMQVGLESYQDISNKILAYLKANSSSNREDNKVFRVSKGIGGGICRWSEYVKKEKPGKK